MQTIFLLSLWEVGVGGEYLLNFSLDYLPVLAWSFNTATFEIPQANLKCFQANLAGDSPGFSIPVSFSDRIPG